MNEPDQDTLPKFRWSLWFWIGLLLIVTAGVVFFLGKNPHLVTIALAASVLPLSLGLLRSISVRRRRAMGVQYKKTEQGKEMLFHTRCQRVHTPFGQLWLALLPAIIFAVVSGWAAFIGTIAFFGVIAWLQTVTPSARRYRKPSRFSVSGGGISVRGTQINRCDIHRVIIRNHVLSADDSSIVAPWDNSAGAAAAALGGAAGRRFRNRLGAISYRVELEASGVATTLAGGLNESTAFAVLSDVSRILGLR